MAGDEGVPIKATQAFETAFSGLNAAGVGSKTRHVLPAILLDTAVFKNTPTELLQGSYFTMTTFIFLQGFNNAIVSFR